MKLRTAALRGQNDHPLFQVLDPPDEHGGGVGRAYGVSPRPDLEAWSGPKTINTCKNTHKIFSKYNFKSYNDT